MRGFGRASCTRSVRATFIALAALGALALAGWAQESEEEDPLAQYEQKVDEAVDRGLTYLAEAQQEARETIDKARAEAQKILGRAREGAHEEADRLLEAMRQTKLMNPPMDCISPIGQELIEAAMRQNFEADFSDIADYVIHPFCW